MFSSYIHIHYELMCICRIYAYISMSSIYIHTIYIYIYVFVHPIEAKGRDKLPHMSATLMNPLYCQPNTFPFGCNTYFSEVGRLFCFCVIQGG